jgi:Domain of unknown function (DUF397)
VDVTGARWRRSSFSSGDDGNNCVEVAFLPDGTVAVRDTKDRSIPAHRYSMTAWHAFTAGIRAGEFRKATFMS